MTLVRETKWHLVREEDQARISCTVCSGAGLPRPAEVCHHAGSPHPFFYYCLSHGLERGYSYHKTVEAQAEREQAHAREIEGVRLMRRSNNQWIMRKGVCAMNEQIEVVTRFGKLALPIKRKIALCGMGGFAVHRPVNLELDGTLDRYWTVSHIATGLCVVDRSETIAESIAEAEHILKHSGYDTPKRFNELIARNNGSCGRGCAR